MSAAAWFVLFGLPLAIIALAFWLYRKAAE
ncbi:MAG: LPXTG cell wall anchor domain-containing protein [Planctomycetota bacterium]|nr:LPXTG cell wall anchor domain-containing protein [Planctomycetota bacterium]